MVPETKETSVRRDLNSALRQGEKREANKTSIIYHPNMHKSEYMDVKCFFLYQFRIQPFIPQFSKQFYLYTVFHHLLVVLPTHANEPQLHQEFISTRKHHMNVL